MLCPALALVVANSSLHCQTAIKEAQQDCSAYEAALKALAQKDLQPLTPQVATLLRPCAVRLS